VLWPRQHVRRLASLSPATRLDCERGSIDDTAGSRIGRRIVWYEPSADAHRAITRTSGHTMTGRPNKRLGNAMILTKCIMNHVGTEQWPHPIVRTCCRRGLSGLCKFRPGRLAQRNQWGSWPPIKSISDSALASAQCIACFAQCALS
jgi:hypothetical protein